MNNVKPIPDGYHTVTPYMVVKNAAKALDFYKRAFNTKKIIRMPDAKGLIMHAEIQVGDSRIMLCDEMPAMNARSPEAFGGSPMSLMIYVDDVDRIYQQAIKAGATELKPVANQFYGDRSGTVKDPFGHTWTLATHVEEVSEAEMKKRMEKVQSSQST